MTETQTKEREEYIRKLTLQIDGIGKILDMNSFDVINDEMAEELRSLQSRAVKLKNKLEKNEFEIAIVGLEKAGKSTFANAMMGNKILPAFDARCTYTSTNIRYDSGDVGIVDFYSKAEFDRAFSDKLRTMGIEHADELNFRSLSLSEYEHLFENLDERDKSRYAGNVNEDVKTILENKQNISELLGSERRTFSGEDQLSSVFFQKYITEPAYAIAVKTVTIKSSKLEKMQNAVIYDVPGFDSPTQIHRDQTIAQMQNADVIILIANASAPSLTAPQLSIFDKESDPDGIRFGDKMFIFANKADRANDTIENNMKKLKEELKKYRIILRDDILSERVIPGSAQAKLEAEGKVEGNNASRGLIDKGIENGIDTIRTRLEEYNSNIRFDVLKNRVNKNLNDVEAVFSKLHLEASSNNNGFNNCLNEISLEVLDYSRAAIIEALDKFEADIKKKYNTDKLLTEKLRKNIIEEITAENFGVTSEELDRMKNKHTDLSGNVDFSKVEKDIRDNKYDYIYHDFIDKTVNLSSDEHTECDKRIQEIFLDAFEYHSAVSDDPFVNAVNDFISKSKGSTDNTGYYRSLAERFSSDLFELMLSYGFGVIERWQRFENDKKNFYSLAMFDEHCDLTIPVANQPLFYTMLFHDDSRCHCKDYVADCVAIVKNLMGIKTDLDSSILSNIYKIVNYKLRDAADFISKECTAIRSSDSNKLQSRIINTISNIAYELTEDEEDNNDTKILNDTYYREYFKDRAYKTEDAFVCELNDDIEKLREILNSAVINAIDIETPFIARESHIIQSLKNSVEDVRSSDFRNLISNNLHFIKANECQEISDQNNKQQIRRDICNTIMSIIESMKNTDQTESTKA